MGIFDFFKKKPTKPIKKGLVKDYALNGTLRYEKTYRDDDSGKLNGPFREWDDEQLTLEVNVVDDLIIDSYKEWYSNGQLKHEGGGPLLYYDFPFSSFFKVVKV